MYSFLGLSVMETISKQRTPSQRHVTEEIASEPQIK